MSAAGRVWDRERVNGVVILIFIEINFSWHFQIHDEMIGTQRFSQDFRNY